MKIIKILLYLVLALVAAVVVAGLVAKKDYHIERSTTINVPREAVFSKVRQLANFNQWSPWAELDPEMKTEIIGPDGQPGTKYTWTGNKKVGIGTLTLLSVSQDRIEQDLYFEGQGSSPVSIELKPSSPTSTEVVWTMDSHVSFPFNAMMLFMDLEKLVGNDFEKGLAKLKNLLETENAQIQKLSESVTEAEMPFTTYAGIRQVVKMAEMEDFMEKNMSRIATIAGSEMAGPPADLMFTWDEVKGETDMAVAVPLARKANFGDPMVDYWILGGKAMTLDYFGPYEGLGTAHFAMDAALAKKGHTLRYPVLEQYMNSPENEPDAAKLHTKLVYFVE